MNRYTIYCTEAQTKKALELGAPIETYKPIIINSKAGGSFTTPTIETVTAEEMIGWLEDQGLNFEGASYYMSVEKKDGDTIGIYSGTRKEATLIAIDAALEHLMNNKK